MKHFPLVIVLAVAVSSAVTYAGSLTKPISGSYAIAGKSLLDPESGEPQDTHFRMYLTGESAKSLYLAMKVEAKRDVCLDDGSVTKEVGEMVCTRHQGGKFSCAFAIDVMRQRIDLAQVC